MSVFKYAYIAAAVLGVILLSGCATSTGPEVSNTQAIVEEYLDSPYEAPDELDYPREVRVSPAYDPRKEWGRAIEADEDLEDPSKPPVVVKVLNKYDDAKNYFVMVNLKNPSDKDGNKTIQVFTYDRLGRLIDSSSEVFFFRAYQQFTRTYRFPKFSKGLPAVRWVIRVK